MIRNRRRRGYDAGMSDSSRSSSRSTSGRSSQQAGSPADTASTSSRSARSSTPQPQYITASWWPANVQVPNDGGTTFTDVRVYATDVGLVIYDAPNREIWRSAIDYATAAAPSGNPRTEGHTVETADGTVYIGLTVVSCGTCGGGALKTWEPAYAGRVVPWGPTGESAAS